MSHDPDSIRRLTESYVNLRGIAQTLPFAFWFLVKHSADFAGVRLDRVAFYSLAIALGVAGFAMHRYYNRRFGVVTRPARWGGGTLVLALIAFVALQVASAYWALPVDLGLLAIGIAIAVYALRHFDLEGQVLLYALIFIALSISPLSYFDARDRESFWFEAGAVAIDMACIIAALWSHRTLVKAFERVSPTSPSGAPLGSR